MYFRKRPLSLRRVPAHAGQEAAAGPFAQRRLIALGAVAPTVGLAPGSQVFNDSFITADLRVSRTFNAGGKRVKIAPEAKIFNVLKVAACNILRDGIQGDPTGSPGAPNGIVQGTLIGLGSRSFSQGAPQTVQFAIRMSF